MSKFDKKGKDILRNKWPRKTTKLFRSSGPPWLRAQPKSGFATTPRLFNAGSESLATQPDGMWINLLFEKEIADVMCIEICGSRQNFFDKRSRYMPTTNSLHLCCDAAWLKEPIYQNQKRYECLDLNPDDIAPTYYFSIRFLRVLYVLESSLYQAWMAHGVPAGHEFFIKQSSLASFAAPTMQSFLKRMNPDQQFYTAG